MSTSLDMIIHVVLTLKQMEHYEKISGFVTFLSLCK